MDDLRKQIFWSTCLRSTLEQRNVIEARAHELLREWPDYLR